MNKADIHIEIILHAPIAAVWVAWTDPAAMTWFGSDPAGEVLQAQMDARPGGCFEICFQNSDKTRHTCFGVYEDVLPPHKLSFSWEWKNEPGVRSLVTVLLSPAPGAVGQTVMQFSHEGVGEASAHDYQKGWRDTFLKLDRALARW